MGEQSISGTPPRWRQDAPSLGSTLLFRENADGHTRFVNQGKFPSSGCDFLKPAASARDRSLTNASGYQLRGFDVPCFTQYSLTR